QQARVRKKRQHEAVQHAVELRLARTVRDDRRFAAGRAGEVAALVVAKLDRGGPPGERRRIRAKRRAELGVGERVGAALERAADQLRAFAVAAMAEARVEDAAADALRHAAVPDLLGRLLEDVADGAQAAIARAAHENAPVAMHLRVAPRQAA